MTDALRARCQLKRAAGMLARPRLSVVPAVQQLDRPVQNKMWTFCSFILLEDLEIGFLLLRGAKKLEMRTQVVVCSCCVRRDAWLSRAWPTPTSAELINYSLRKTLCLKAILNVLI